EPSEPPEPSQRSALSTPSAPGARATGGASPLSPAGRIIGGTVSTLVLVAAAAFVLTAGKPGERAAAPPEPPPAASQQPEPSADVGCEGPDCTGQDPEAMRCGGPHARTVAEAVLGDARVEVRHSQACGAAWARVTGAAPGDTLRISAADASQRGEVGEAGETYTPMVATADPDAPTACVTTPAGAERCTAVSG
ncbi:MAG TPA: DUF2690 domain-containing protein, partial [Streptomyces sp.]|nr:DUF2690 domain-containing protein [Streptomyces sp.]